MPDRTRLPIAPTVRSYTLDADRILFDTSTDRLYVLNEAAAHIWDAVERGLDSDLIADEIAARTGADADVVRADCDGLIRRWLKAGLLAPDSPEAEPGPVAEEDAEAEPPDLGADEPDVERRSYRICDLTFTLEGEADAFELVGRLFRHCRLDTAPDDAVVLSLARRTDGWALIRGQRVIGECDDDDELAPLVHTSMLHLTYLVSESLIAIHGSAVFAGGRAVLFPGVPGAGKSTLTAALVTAGFGYCTDDLALLAGEPLRLRAVPLCMGIKEGAWPALEGRIPGLADIRVDEREDRKLVRYLPPAPDRLPGSDGDRFDVAAVVFPAFAADAPCQLSAMPRSAALLRIAESGYHLIDGLDERRVTAALEWLRGLDCYELRYSALDDAIREVGKLLS